MFLRTLRVYITIHIKTTLSELRLSASASYQKRHKDWKPALTRLQASYTRKPPCQTVSHAKLD